MLGYTTRSLVPECIGGGTIATKISLAIGSPIPLRVETLLDGKLKVPLCIVLGCCGGLSAAFNSPLSGIVFAIEEYMDIRQEGMVATLV
eukprot:g13828.t1